MLPSCQVESDAPLPSLCRCHRRSLGCWRRRSKARHWCWHYWISEWPERGLSMGWGSAAANTARKYTHSLVWLLSYPSQESCSAQADPSIMSPAGPSMAKDEFCSLVLGPESVPVSIPGAEGTICAGNAWGHRDPNRGNGRGPVALPCRRSPCMGTS